MDGLEYAVYREGLTLPTPIASRLQRKGILRRDIEGAQADVRAMLTRARNSIDAAILSAARKGNFGTSAAVREKLYDGIAKAYGDFGGDLSQWAESRTKDLMKQWHGLAFNDLPANERDTTFGQFSEQHFKDYLAYFHPGNVKQLAAVNVMATQDIRFMRQQFVDVFRESAVTGSTMREMQKELFNRVTAQRPSFKFVDTSGREWKADNYFNMLTRTSVTGIARDSYVDTAADAGHDLFMVIGGLPTSPPPDPCWDWYGKIVSLTGATKGYPTVEEAEADGLFHVNCIHGLGVVLDDEVEEFKELETEADDERQDAIAEAEKEAEEEKAKAA